MLTKINIATNVFMGLMLLTLFLYELLKNPDVENIEILFKKYTHIKNNITDI